MYTNRPTRLYSVVIYIRTFIFNDSEVDGISVIGRCTKVNSFYSASFSINHITSQNSQT